jgi:nicotinic acid mononucleotide adenylyltransferase
MKFLLQAIKNTTLICSLISSSTSSALILEDLVADNKLESTLKDQKICFYPGSFNIVHRGHEAVANLVIEKKLCNFVIIYPLWSSDNYKKRTPLDIRLKMLFATFQSHPKIIVTKLSPRDLQNTLTSVDNLQQNFVTPKYNITFVGITGSDNALKK